MVKISVIIPCYNQEEFIGETLDSVLAQTFSDYEIIIVNDGSADNSPKIINGYRDNYPDKIKIVNQENCGLPAARNAGIREAQGEYIFPLDGDDKISSDCLQSLYDAIQTKRADVVFSKVVLFGQLSGLFILKNPTKYNMVYSNCVVCSSLYKKEDWLRFGGYDENMRNGLEDWDFWLNFIEAGKKFYKVKKELLFYRIENNFVTNMARENEEKITEYIFAKHSALKKYKERAIKFRWLYRNKMFTNGVIRTKILGIPVYYNRSFNA